MLDCMFWLKRLPRYIDYWTFGQKEKREEKRRERLAASKHHKTKKTTERHLPFRYLITCCAEPVIGLPSAQDAKLGVGQRAGTKANPSVRSCSAAIFLIPFLLSVAEFQQTDASVTVTSHQPEVVFNSKLCLRYDWLRASGLVFVHVFSK